MRFKSATMKFSIATLFTLIVCLSAYVSVQEFKGPFEKVLKEKLNLSTEEFKKQCESQPKNSGQKIMKSQAIASKIGTALANDVMGRAKKLPKVDDQKWDELVKDRCRTNPAVKVLTEISVDRINKCLNEDKRLKDDKKIEFTKSLLRGYCMSVKKLAKKKYGGGKD